MRQLVECRSDYTYAQRPLALIWENQRLEVTEVLASWRTPQGLYFRVRVQDGKCFELRYQESGEEWQIHPL